MSNSVSAGPVRTPRFSSPDEFMDHVLQLAPEVAVFDFDGTLWPGDCGERFLRWSIERGLVKDEAAQTILARYEIYKAGGVAEHTMCGEMVQVYAGLSERDLRQTAEQFIAEYVRPHLFPEIARLVRELHARGAELWAVSSTNVWVIGAGVSALGIPFDHVLAVDLVQRDGKMTDTLVHVPSGPGKAAALREYLPGPPDAVFGNSIFDLQMLEMAGSPFAVNPNPDLAQIAQQRGWPIYWPTGARPSSASTS